MPRSAIACATKVLVAAMHPLRIAFNVAKILYYLQVWTYAAQLHRHDE